MHVLLYSIFFPIDIRPKKCVIKLFPEILLCLNFAIIDARPKKRCDKALAFFLTILKFVPDWFVTSKSIKKVDDLFSKNDIIFVQEDSDNVTKCQ